MKREGSKGWRAARSMSAGASRSPLRCFCDAKQTHRSTPVTSDQRQAIAERGKLDAIGKFQDAAQTLSLYTISLWLVPDSLLAAVSSNACEQEMMCWCPAMAR